MGRNARLPLLALAAWGGALCGLWAGHAVVWGVTIALVLVPAVVLVRVMQTRPHVVWRRWALPLILVAVVFGLLGAVRESGARSQVMTQLAEHGRAVEIEAVVHSDPRAVNSGFGERVVVVLLVRRAARADGRSGLEHRWRVREQVTLLAGSWPDDAVLGARVRVRAVGLEGDVSHGHGTQRRSTWVARGQGEVVEGPDLWWRGAERVRASLREVVRSRPQDQRALVPSLVVGDDAAVPEDLAEAFRTTGLTHLLAVSGTNLTLLMGVVLWCGSWCGVRGRWRWGLAGLCIVGFVLVARSEPSVVRAATMGAVALFALERNATARGLRCLAAAVLVILAWDPWMARSVGLALSVLATAGILVLSPSWSAALERWLPRWVALGVAVPAAAQLACTPVVAAIQGEVSLVAVLTNVLAAPAVAPATVLGLVAGVVGVVFPRIGTLIALPAAWSVGWVALVARWGAGLELPAWGWGTGAVQIGLLSVLCLVAVPVIPWVLRRRGPTLLAVTLVMGLVVWGLPERGWPPNGWLAVACDVGQGDALVVRVGEGAAIVVDAGPEAGGVRRCLDRLGVREVPLLVLTHFHADHVEGVPGVVEGRNVRTVEVSPHRAPEGSAEQVQRWLSGTGASYEIARAGTSARVGEALVTRVWPPAEGAPVFPGGDVANDSSVVLLVEVRGVRILLTGDVEPGAQRRVATMLEGVTVDVVKVPHHGSRHQDLGFLTGLGARVALVSSGEGNTYGHPSEPLLEQMTEAGITVLRTDRSGDIAVLHRDGDLATATRGRPHS